MFWEAVLVWLFLQTLATVIFYSGVRRGRYFERQVQQGYREGVEAGCRIEASERVLREQRAKQQCGEGG